MWMLVDNETSPFDLDRKYICYSVISDTFLPKIIAFY